MMKVLVAVVGAVAFLVMLVGVWAIVDVMSLWTDAATAEAAADRRQMDKLMRDGSYLAGGGAIVFLLANISTSLMEIAGRTTK